MKRYYPIPKDEFEREIIYLNGREYLSEEYRIDEEFRKRQKIRVKEFKEHCYIIPITEHFCIKTYSSIKREGEEVARDKGRDSIKVVAACSHCLTPVNDPYPITKRLETWEQNFKDQLLDVLGSLGNERKCPNGNHIMAIKRNSKNGKLFIGCTWFNKTKQCRGNYDIRVNEPIHCNKLKMADQIFPYRY